LSYSAYKKTLEVRYWDYWRRELDGRLALLREGAAEGSGPPVFRSESNDLNILTDESDTATSNLVVREVPRGSRHRWFGSFNSSQALAQSVFANLKHAGKLGILSGIRDEDGLPIFGDGTSGVGQMTMEFPVNYLGEVESRSTEVDVRFGDTYRTCVECKFTESEVGSCSRPKLRRSEPGYEKYHCDGSFSRQRGRDTRCSLTEVGIRYWEYLPPLLGWNNDRDHASCPLRTTYQLVRNVLAACVSDGGKLGLDSGHAVLLYDERNPCFREGGAGFKAWQVLRRDLRKPQLLRLCSWQALVSTLRRDAALAWLTSALHAKYGF